jgi:hypothetical protein
MENKYREVVLKEYPKYTRWMKGQMILGVGNLILTNERLIFLNQVVLSPKHLQTWRKLIESGNTSKQIDFTLTLHKKNFEVPLSSVISANMKRYCLFPFPRPYLNISYRGGSKDKEKTLSFMFTISLLKGFYQLEVSTIWMWVRIIRKALQAKNSSIVR